MAKLMHEEKIGYKRDKINMYILQKNELIEKEKKKKKKKNIIKIDENNNNEEEKNIEQNNEKTSNQENDNDIINENQNKQENKSEKSNEKEKKSSNENITENNEKNNNENNEEEKKEKNEEGNNEEKKINQKNAKSKKDKAKKDSQNILSITKEDLEEKISKLENELIILEKKTDVQIIEDFYNYLELDDSTKYHKRMIGYTRPFLVREDDTRNPEKNVKNPVKFNKQSIMRKYEYLIQRRDNINKQKELESIKEKDIKFEERKKSFNRQLRQLEKNYDTKIKKDNYIQIKKNEEDYIKGKNSKLTWKIIQKNDYQTFLLNDENNININSVPSQLKDIFNKNDYTNDFGDDDDFINKIYSNNNNISQQRKGFNESKLGKGENSRYDGGESFSKFSNLSID